MILIPKFSCINHFQKKILFIFLIFSFLFLNCSSESRHYSSSLINEEKNSVRVLIGKFNSFDFKVNEEIFLLTESKKVAQIKIGNEIRFTTKGERIIASIKKKHFEATAFFISPSNIKNGITLNNNFYPGYFSILNSGNNLLLVNTLSENLYLSGVLNSEIGFSETKYFNALKAFAICARTFLHQNKKNSNIFFDIGRDINSQVFKGINKSKTIFNKAVEETEGVYLSINNSIAEIFYHSTCGGRTANANEVFEKGADYLISIKDGESPNCTSSTRFSWEHSFSMQELNERIKKFFSNEFDSNDECCDITITKKSSSERVLEIVIKTKKNKKLTLAQTQIRNFFKPNNNYPLLESSLFEIQIEKKDECLNNVKLIGKGFGHGVGFCQWGALSLSEQGKDFIQILKHYFPKLKIT